MRSAGIEPSWIDSHCHLQDASEITEVLGRARAAGVSGFVCIGTDLNSSRQAIEIAHRHGDLENGGIWATVGVHPHEAKEGITGLEDLAASSTSDRIPVGASGQVVAIGECGLDYHYEHSPRDVQRECFEAQIELAKRYRLALVVHTREAWEETISIFAAVGLPDRTIVHCFTGGPEEARRCLDLGAYLSFSGIVTFKNASPVRAAAELCPLDRLLVETDAPYLAPVPHRGEQNESAYVTFVGEAVAQLRGIEPAVLAAHTRENCIKAFALRL